MVLTLLILFSLYETPIQANFYFTLDFDRSTSDAAWIFYNHLRESLMWRGREVKWKF
jgi:hypothetical protein